MTITRKEQHRERSAWRDIPIHSLIAQRWYVVVV